MTYQYAKPIRKKLRELSGLDPSYDPDGLVRLRRIRPRQRRVNPAVPTILFVVTTRYIY